ncbi:RHS repeat-associated core domain-containing protein [Myxococcus sp. 1LA]
MDGTSTVTQVAQGNPVTDADGTRQATVLFPPGTQASLVIPGVGTRELDSLSVRATEYTVGASGPAAMPGSLPSATGYTYAVELGADEAIEAGASSIEFSQPVAFYVDNFLGFPVGDAVPVGAYNRFSGRWVAENNGRIIAIVGEQAGLAQVDINGDGVADSNTALQALGITAQEREQLAALYDTGKSLWRVALTHFTPWDCNWPYGPPPDARPPAQPRPKPEMPAERPDCQSGSIIECQNQTLGESITLTGTPHQLSYRSDRMPGRQENYTLRVPLTGATLPGSLARIVVQASVAGQSLGGSFAPATNLTHELVWNGKDAYGRPVTGSQRVTGATGYVYRLIYQEPADFSRSFAALSGTPYTAARETREVTLWQRWETQLTATPPQRQAVAGWALDSHHQYDPESRTLTLGNGGRRAADNAEGVFVALAGTGVPGQSTDGTPALSAQLNAPSDIAAGADGRVYIADYGNRRIVRIDLDGRMHTHFSGGTSFTPVSLKVGPDGNVFVADYDNHRVWRITPYGWADIYAGTGSYGGAGDGGRAQQAQLAYPVDMVVAPDGTLYIADKNNHRIRRVTPDGYIYSLPPTFFYPESITLAPDGSLYVADMDGVHRITAHGDSAPVAELSGCCSFDTVSVEALPDGSLLVMDYENARLRRLFPDGTLRDVAQGAGCGASTYAPASDAQFCSTDGVASAPDGTLLVSDYAADRARRFVPVLPERSTEITVPSESGLELYVFDSQGRHLRTVDTVTRAALHTFTYDPEGRLTGVTDLNGQLTEVERDVAGVPVAIVAPHGQRTTLGVDTNGFLSSVTNPAGEAITLGYTASGLLTSMVDARLGAHTFTYDTVGRLVRDDFPSGGWKELTRTRTATGHDVSLSTGLGRVTRYRVQAAGDGSQVRTTTYPSGVSDTTTLRTDGSMSYTTANGMSVSLLPGVDPRFGMQSPLMRQQTVRTPSGLTSQTGHTRTVSLVQGGTLLDLDTLTDTFTVNGRVHTSHYDASTREWLMTTPLGRTATTRLDAQGRVVRQEVPGELPVLYDYDTLGRLESVQQGTRIGLMTYDTAGLLSSVTDASGRTSSYTHDLAGRLAGISLPGNRQVGLSMDAHGNLTSLTPPGRPAHAFNYSPADAVSSYTSPAVPGGSPPKVFGYDLDEALTSVTLPDGTAMSYGYDAAGRIETIQSPTFTRTLGYRPGSGQLGHITNVGGASLAFTHDGDLLTGVTWSGAIQGSVGYTYNADFQVASLRVNANGTPMDYRYDDDGLLTGVGPLAMARASDTDVITGTTLQSVTTSHGYNAYGELDSQTAAVSGTSLLSDAVVTRDDLGRVTDRTEMVLGVTKSYHYTYDVAGRLESVAVDGQTPTTYGYDANGNRTQVVEGGVTRTATYDAQDRLLTSGDTTYTSGPNGDLQQKMRAGASRPTEYLYDATGALTGVVLEDNTRVDYVLDALGRRVGRKVNGTLTKGFLYDGALRVVAELDGNGQVVSRFIYATRGHAPDAMVKGGVTYRILSDAHGSPRLVVNAASGAVAQRMDYDVWGRVLNDTAPGFQPFGYAGGLYDGATGLTRFGVRDYDAEVGRWTTKDPIRFAGGDTNLYAYVGNDPINLIDPTGLSATSLARCFGKGLVAGAIGAVAMVAIGALAATVLPVAAVTGTMIALGVIGGMALGFDIGAKASMGHWDAVAYDVGSAVGGLAVGGASGRMATRAFNGVESPKWSLSSDRAQGYNPKMGTFSKWLGTGLNPGSAAAANGFGGSAGAIGARQGGCAGDCN